MEVLKESSSGKRKVLPELQIYENDRLNRLEQIKLKSSSSGTSTTKLHNIWPLTTPFDIYVYLSERSDPITRFQLQKDNHLGRVLGLPASSDDSESTSPSSSTISNETYYGLLHPGAMGGNLGSTEHSPPLFWHQSYLTYDSVNEKNSREQHFNISLPPNVLLRNASLYAHVYFCALGSSPDPSASNYLRPRVIQTVHPLIKYLKLRPKKRTVNLLTGEGDDNNVTHVPKQAMFGIGMEPTPKPQENTNLDISSLITTTTAEPNDDKPIDPAVLATLPYLPYIKPTLHLQLIVDHSIYTMSNMPPHVLSTIDIEPELSGYKPPLYINEFWLLNHHLKGPLNDTTPFIPFTISYNPQSMWKWAIQTQMTASWDAQAAMGTSSEGDTDMIKSIITDANPILLIVTAIVSTLHMIFEFLAFKNDISFWRGAKSLEGLSIRSLIINFVQMLIITLYLFENETSWMILISQVIGLGIELWKLRKAVAVNLEWKGWRPSLTLTDIDEGYAKSLTKEYDDIATHHMLIVLAPLIVGYALYSLFYDRHRSWYSWLVTSAVNYVYMFGFVQLVPQLYINYRLKSVAHMPWRVHVYRFFNTIIDDLFAFVVKMPTLHRIAVFRDDIIFILLLVQRWYYPIDVTRKNEYGTSKLDEEVDAALKRGEKRVCRRSKYDKIGKVEITNTTISAGS